MVRPFSRTRTARPGASGEVTPEKTEAIFLSLGVSDDCADVLLAVPRANSATIVMMSLGFTEPPTCAPQHIICAPNNDRMRRETANDVISALLPSYSVETRFGIVSS